jgi:hypothetical protein
LIVVTMVETKSKRQRSLKRKLFYSAIPTILAFLIIEGLFRLYFLVKEDVLVGRIYEELSHNPACASKPWFSREFVASKLVQPPNWYTPPGYSLILASDYKDKFFTIRDGIRATVGFDPQGVPPGRRPRKLVLLGASTTYCAEVPDEFTWASQLQKRLAAIPETRDIEVVNCGITTVVSLQEVERLEYEIRRNNIPDFCIFFDGMGDAFVGVMCGKPGGTMIGEYRRHTDTVLFATLKQIGRISVAATTIYRSILTSQLKNNSVDTRSKLTVREQAEATANLYERNMLRAKEICDRYRIRMIVFLQPHLYSIGGRPWTSHERAMADAAQKIHGFALRACYPLLREKVSRLRQRGIIAYDITEAFDRNLEPIFADDLHVETAGNGIIAAAILEKALPVLKESSSLAVAPPVEPGRRAER